VKTFIASIGVLTILAAGIIYLSGKPKAYSESYQEGYTQPAQYIQFEPMEINVPVQVFDFSDEEPMLITPDMDE
jgi:hypothetical protein